MAWHHCDYCKRPIKPGELGSYRLVRAWVQERKTGSLTALNPEGLDKYIHELCWTAKRLDGAEQQELL